MKKTSEFLILIASDEETDNPALVVRALEQLPTVADARAFSIMFYFLSIFTTILTLVMSFTTTMAWEPLTASLAVAAITVGSFNANKINNRMYEIVGSYSDVFEDD